MKILLIIPQPVPGFWLFWATPVEIAPGSLTYIAIPLGCPVLICSSVSNGELFSSNPNICFAFELVIPLPSNDIRTLNLVTEVLPCVKPSFATEVLTVKSNLNALK